jgi:sigma-54 dependent transcriptional regulator, acetoin dehydrogenase operon transcriptional activator AcoR
MPSAYRQELTTLKVALESLTEPDRRAETELLLGSLLIRLGDYDQALLHLNGARRFYEHKKDDSKLCEVDHATGVACTAKNEHERALGYLQSALTIARRRGDAASEARILISLGVLHQVQGDAARALEHYEKARKHFDGNWNGQELARCLGGQASLHALEGRFADALELATRATEEGEASGDALEFGRSLLIRADVHWRAGDPRTAKRYYRRAIALFTDQELPRELAEAYYRYGEFVGAASNVMPEGFPDPPAYWLAKSQELFREYGTLGDIERVREAFRRFGRRATDRIAEVEVLSLIQELKQERQEVQREVGKLGDTYQEWFRKLGVEAPPPLRTEIAAAADEVARVERMLSRRIDQMAAAEQRFLGALNSVILERENIRTLLDLCRNLNVMGDFSRIVQDTAKMAAQLVNADRALVALRASEEEPVELTAAVRISADDKHEWRAAVEKCMHSKSALFLQRKSDEQPGGDPRSSERGSLRLAYAICVPLRHAQTVFGAVYVDKELCGGVFTERDLDLLVIFCSQVATILENTRIAEELRLAARQKAATLEAITDGVVALDSNGHVASINAVAARILGVGTEQATRMGISELPDLGFLKATLEQGEDFDSRVTRVGAGEYLVNARAVRGDAGKVASVVATFTEMKRATSIAQKIVGTPARYSLGDIIGTSQAIRKRLQLAEAAARSDSSVLITGESGTGKEVLAQAIHNASARASGPFVGINCAAIPRELLESELFGYEGGAFTGAKRGGHPGKFELAEGGTILLDEIGDMPLEMQAKLLRVLQERRVQRIGGTRDIKLDARVIATTNRDLTEDVQRGRFRQDLFFRLKVIHIPLPALRERAQDIPLLVEHYLQLFAVRLGKKVGGVSAEVMEAFLSYSWPGNIRELENVLEGEVNLCPPSNELLDQIPEALGRSGIGRRLGVVGAAMAGGGAVVSGVTSLENAERELLLAALEEHNGSVPDVARALGVSRGTVYNKMKKFAINPDEFRKSELIG